MSTLLENIMRIYIRRARADRVSLTTIINIQLKTSRQIYLLIHSIYMVQ
jgi:hypothetical protein